MTEMERGGGKYLGEREGGGSWVCKRVAVWILWCIQRVWAAPAECQYLKSELWKSPRAYLGDEWANVYSIPHRLNWQDSRRFFSLPPPLSDLVSLDHLASLNCFHFQTSHHATLPSHSYTSLLIRTRRSRRRRVEEMRRRGGGERMRAGEEQVMMNR